MHPTHGIRVLISSEYNIMSLLAKWGSASQSVCQLTDNTIWAIHVNSSF